MGSVPSVDVVEASEDLLAFIGKLLGSSAEISSLSKVTASLLFIS